MSFRGGESISADVEGEQGNDDNSSDNSPEGDNNDSEDIDSDDSSDNNIGSELTDNSPDGGNNTDDPVLTDSADSGIDGTGDPVVADGGDGNIGGTGDPVVADGGDGNIGDTGDPIVADGGDGGIDGTGDPVVADGGDGNIGGTGDPVVADGGDGGTGGTGDPVVADGGDGNIGGTGDPVVADGGDGGIGGTGDPIVADGGDGNIGDTGDPIVADGGDGGIGGTGDPIVADGGDGGIGGTGDPVVAEYTGTITGFGSVFVNGVEFFTSSSDIKIDDEESLENDLKLGMFVNITGEVNAGGITGNAFKIRAEHNLTGTIEGDPQLVGENSSLKKITILGRTVILDKYSTVFHSRSDRSANFDFGKISVNDYVSLSGFLDNNNNIYATHCEDLGRYDPDLSTVSISGIVSDYDGINEFEIDDLEVEIMPGTDLSGLDGYSIENGMRVRVTGILTDSDSVHALTIKLTQLPTAGSNDLSSGSTYKVIEGSITSLDEQQQSFMINGLLVEFSNVQASSQYLTLKNLSRVEVAGTVENNVLHADTIITRNGGYEISGIVKYTDLENKNISIEVVPGQEILVKVDARTLTNNNKNRLDRNNSITSFIPTDYLDIQASLANNGDLTANAIQENKLNRNAIHRLRGHISSINRADHEITVLGTTISVADLTRIGPSALHIETVDQFFDMVSVGDMITIEDERIPGCLYGDGVADDIQIIE